ncbi:DUF2059 domain-containing protein [Variovorax boronicumulans]|uniref:DUF2059 domain-containing protein n=1 Tax=Variovorax boronicumulans TaxID=436515 RepID=UPI001C57F36A
MKKFKLAVLTVALAASSIAMAQDKAALVKQLLEVQRPAIDGMARILVNDSVAPILQAGGEYLQTQVPPEKREALGKAAEAEVQKYVQEAFPIVRDKAVQLAPSTVGPLLEQNFNEDELRQLITWLSSPLNKKFAELNPQLGSALTQKLVTDVRPTIDPKLQALNVSVAKALGAPTDGQPPAAQPAAKPAAKAPAKK